MTGARVVRLHVALKTRTNKPRQIVVLRVLFTVFHLDQVWICVRF